jgi:hypothetical protein
MRPIAQRAQCSQGHTWQAFVVDHETLGLVRVVRPIACPECGKTAVKTYTAPERDN